MTNDKLKSKSQISKSKTKKQWKEHSGLMNTKESKTGILPVTNEDTSGIRIKKIRQSYTANRTPIKRIGHLRIGNFI
jgi:hypothetical protein